MNTPAIVVKVSIFGDVEIDAQCFKGSKCVEATAAFEKVLAGSRSDRTMKDDFYAPEEVQNSAQNIQRL